MPTNWDTNWINQTENGTAVGSTGCNVNVWTNWVSSSTIAYNRNIWSSWTNAETTSLTINQNQWMSWNSTYIQASGNTVYISQPYAPSETPEQKIQREALHAQWCAENQARELAAQKRRGEAQTRARKILLEHLAEPQRLELESMGRFHVAVGEKTYRIERKAQHNVFLLNKDGSVEREYCAILDDPSVPLDDLLLSQKLILESDEKEFHLAANAWDVKNGYRQVAFAGRR